MTASIASLHRRVVAVFAKEPRPGRVKTRLAPSVSPEWAALVADAFLRDILDRLAEVNADKIVCYTPPDSGSFFEWCRVCHVALTPQAEGDLGCRMAAFFAEQFQAGAGPVVVVGSDSPTLPVRFIEQAFEFLENADVVLAPATDGGYCLVGCARQVPEIFRDIPWGTNTVLSTTVRQAVQNGYRLAMLPPWYDVDTWDDWQMLVGHLHGMRAAGIDPGVPRTERLAKETHC
jgi:uncharacterized protein